MGVLTTGFYYTDNVLASNPNFVLFQFKLNNRLTGWITAFGMYG